MHSHENETTHFCVVRDKDIEFDTWSHFRYSGVKLCEAKTHRNHALTQDVTSLFNNNDIFRLILFLTFGAARVAKLQVNIIQPPQNKNVC